MRRSVARPTAIDDQDTRLDTSVAAMPHGPFANLRRRIVLTYRYHGARQVAWRVVTFPIRFTPLRHRLKLGSPIETEQRRAASWYREKGRPVTVVIPTFGDPRHVGEAVRSIRRTTRAERVRIVVADDASDASDVAALRAIDGIDRLILGERNVGFAANANRGIAAADPATDVVLLNADIVAREAWLDCLQYAAYACDDIGIVGAKLLYPDGRIQHAGVHRNLGLPIWFDHRFRFKPADYGPANVTAPVLAVTGACMYVKRAVLDAVGLLDERYPMAYEDVDWCLRAWEGGFRVVYFPPATLYHLESATRGTEVGERELASQTAFWERWGDFFDGRGPSVRSADGHLRVIYVTEDTGVGGGHRDIFEHLNRLQARG
ncbi:MAG TPA: glycosyltransferase family 2 protein, partial [Solirubrobacteraceae bacterium]|nr:glycosyltransferase family 2 protein [Solirubrobacteraceae bacterium]